MSQTNNSDRMEDLHIAPGCRIEVRNEEWLVRRVAKTTSNGLQLTCVGISELVRDKDAVFLTEIDCNPLFGTTISVLRPENTVFVADSSTGFVDSQLYIEAMLRRTVPTDGRLYRGHRAVMDAVPYQLQPALQALQQPRQRILIADAVGLGKTIEAGVLCSELISRGKGKRILVVVIKSMLTQFQQEFWNRFTIPLVRLDSIGIQHVQNQIPTNHNPFFYYDKAIVSIDTLKHDIEYRNYLEQARWDIIIIDEAHNVALRGKRSQRSRLAQLLADRSDTLIMLSATPHDGRARSFASLLNMLDTTAIVNPEKYRHADYADKGLVIRRFKKDIKDQVGAEFKEREIRQYNATATVIEEAVYNSLVELHELRLDKGAQAGELFKTTLTKALFSSPAACRETLRKRIQMLAKKGASGAVDREQLSAVDAQLELLTNAHFSKYQMLLKVITDTTTGCSWQPEIADDRLVIFTERIATLRFLRKHLTIDLNLNDTQVEILHGDLSDMEQQRVVNMFGHAGAPVRLLICSDVAAEGINLHYLSHRMIHFDIPWSLMVFQQRNGRIDRYGQERNPQIIYLMTESHNTTILGDNRILEVLIQKDEQAVKNIGDPSAFMGVYDYKDEERLTAAAIEQGVDAAKFDAQYQAKFDNFDSPLAAKRRAGTGAKGRRKVVEQCAQAVSLYPSNYEYMKAAIKRISQTEKYDVITKFAANDKARRLEFSAPDSLQLRFDKLGREIWPQGGHFILSEDKQVVMAAITAVRHAEEKWPSIHYLWEQNPVCEWLNDKVTGWFKRQQAPAIKLGEQLAPNEIIYLVSAQVANRKGQPILHHWLAVTWRQDHVAGIEHFAAMLTRIKLGRMDLPKGVNANKLAQLQQHLPSVVKEVDGYMGEQCQSLQQQLRPKLQQRLQDLADLETRHVSQFAATLQKSAQVTKLQKTKLDQQSERVRSDCASYRQWLKESMEMEEKPFSQIVAAFVH